MWGKSANYLSSHLFNEWSLNIKDIKQVAYVDKMSYSA